MKLGKYASAALLMTACLLAVTGCQKKEGPMEHAGKEIDQAVDKLSEPKAGPAEQLGQAVDNAAATTGQKIEDAGDRLQDAAKGDAK
ncbi:MAG: hypothetical protein IPG66_01150 [Hydrogenophilales bacterium]|nr:hypothetical protein [Hydrogenophilales bacterium]